MMASRGWTARRDNAPRRGLAPGLRKEGPKVEYLSSESNHPALGRFSASNRITRTSDEDQARSEYIDEILARRARRRGRE